MLLYLQDIVLVWLTSSDFFEILDHAALSPIGSGAINRN